jgi:MFS family permease
MQEPMRFDGTHLKQGIHPRHVFRALRHRNFRIFFLGQSISLVGTWMQQVALSWLVYRMTNSPFMLGLVGFVGMIPAFVCTPFAGVYSDRLDRRRMLVATQALALVQAAVLAFLVLAHWLHIWHVIVLSAFLGIINSFDIPVRQAFIVEMIDDRGDLGNAIALNSSMLNAARLLGPAAAGLLIGWAGEGMCFLLNAASYVPVVLSLLMMKVSQPKTAVHHPHVFLELKEGLSYAYRFPPIRYILLILSLISLMGMSCQVLMPVFARDIFHGGASTLGFLLGMSGAGALAGALYLAARKSVVGLGGIIGWMAGIFGVSMIVFAFSRDLFFSMGIIFVSGFGLMVHMAACNTILQTIVDEDKRGRVMGFYTMAFMGTAPFGSLLAGSLAARIGAPVTFFLSGCACLAGAAFFFMKLPLIRQHIRPIYARRGIIPEVAKGIQSASGLTNMARE